MRVKAFKTYMECFLYMNECGVVIYDEVVENLIKNKLVRMGDTVVLYDPLGLLDD